MAVLDLINSATDRLRLNVADTSDLPIFPDSVYEYILTKNNNNEVSATIEVAQLILGQLSQRTDQRIDRLQFYGSQAFGNYLAFIKEVITNPTNAGNLAQIYIAGVYKADVEANNNDTSVVHHHLPSYGRDCEEYNWHLTF